jgi:phosphoribosylformylglycinamidine synthase
LVDGFSTTLAQPEIQKLFFYRQQSKIHFTGTCDTLHFNLGMAGCTNYFHHLYSSIFAIQKSADMKYTVAINVMPLKDLLDPQGKAVLGGLGNLGLSQVMDVRIGKRITLEIEAADENAAKKVAEEAATKLLANQVMEHFEISII